MKFRPWASIVALACVVLALLAGCGRSAAPGPTQAPAAKKDVILATTTSTRDSGLLDVLIPAFEQKTGYKVKMVAVGTGAALAMGERGEADVLLVHAPAAEKKVVEKGAAINRRLVMHNDFVIVGPSADPAGVKGARKVVDAFRKIKESQAKFGSRGDDSGTHKMEVDLWKNAGLEPGGAGYIKSGSGMGDTLRIASERGAYTLTDRATYLANRKMLSLDILLEGDPVLLNIYHVMEVNPARFASVNAAGGKAFADFLLSADAQGLISKFGADKFGQPLFFADGGKKEEDFK